MIAMSYFGKFITKMTLIQSLAHGFSGPNSAFLGDKDNHCPRVGLMNKPTGTC